MLLVALVGCDRASHSSPVAEGPDEPSPKFRNVQTATAYVGDSACASCHATETAAYRQHGMSQSFHAWTPETRVETALDTPIVNRPTGLQYAVVDSGGRLYQVELLLGPGGKRLHELRRRIDYVMGSGNVARTYFTQENGWMYQLPLTWYRGHGWDFSPGYELHNARFDRTMPDRCVACHASYPKPTANVEGKYAELRAGIGCERCHGPGALHVTERRAGVRPDSAYDATIVNPAHLPIERRLDTCEQCHVHTPVNVLRTNQTAFSFVPSQRLRDQWALFKLSGSIDVVSHADRLKQSACFIATRNSSRPLECATCHDPHKPPPTRAALNQPCQSCHQQAALQQQLARSSARADHTPTADCASCHMPRVEERTVPHGTFTEHWIRVVKPGEKRPVVARAGNDPIEPYFARDRSGPESAIYRNLGAIIYGTQASDGRVLGGAADSLRSALEGDTTRADAHFLLGVAYATLGRTTDALPALERSVRSDSTRAEPLRALAKAYEAEGRAPAAIEALYRRVLALQPALAWIRAEYADFLDAQGRPADAEREYRSALAEQPSQPIVWFDLGTVLAESGRLDDASRAFREAVHLDPALGQAISSLVQMRMTGDAVSGVRRLGSPLPSLAVRSRPPGAVDVTTVTDGTPGVAFINVPPRGLVQILGADGSLVRALSTSDGGTVPWDLRTTRGAAVGSGLYRVQVLSRDASGGRNEPQQLMFGVVRQRGE